MALAKALVIQAGITKQIPDADTLLSGSSRVANGTDAFAEFDDGLTAAVSAAGEGRLRYNDTTKTFQVSIDNGAYTDLATGGAESLAATLAAGDTTGANDIKFTGGQNIIALGDGVAFGISYSAAATASAGGALALTAQQGNGVNAGGAASLTAGGGGLTGAGGAATLAGGAATGTDGNGGQANVLGGAAAGEDVGGAVVVTGGAAPGSAAGGGINIDGGTSVTGDGGAVDIDGGVGGNADGPIRIGTNANGGVTVSYAGGGGISLADGTIIGSATNQTVIFTARVRLDAGVSIAFQNTVDHLLRPDQSTGGAVGRAIDVTGGRAATGGGLAGGAGRINGGSGDGAGAGGAAEVTGGGGGATGEGGIAKIQGGNGGFTSGDGGAARVVGGNAPTSGTGGGVLINAGTGSVAKGSIFIGDTNAAAIQLGNATDNTPVTIAGSGGLQMTTDGFVKMDESAAAPSTAANEGAIYTKDVSGATQLFYREDSNGTEHQITPGTGAAAGKLVISVDTTTNTMLTGQAGYFDANARVAQTDASAIGTSRLAGFYQGVSGQIQIAGVVDVTGRITGGTPAAGAPVYLDTATPGNVTGTAPSAGGDVVAEVGIMLSAAAFTMLIQPKSVIQL